MRLFALSIFLAATARAGTARVLVVAADGSGNFLDLQPAVDAAQDGDVILVRSGTYGTFAIADRSVTMTADIGANVVIQGAARVRNLSFDRTVVLSGLQAAGSGTVAPGRHGLVLTSNDGSVRVQDCSFVGASAAPAWDQPGYAAATVVDCTDVAFDTCTLEGGRAAGGAVDPGMPTSGAGIEVTQSNVSIRDSSCTGGSGIDLEPYGTTAGWDGGNGGPGMLASAANVTLSGVGVRGGRGGNGAYYAPLLSLGGDGGNGIEASSAYVYVHDTAPIAGQGGRGYMGQVQQDILTGQMGAPFSGAQFFFWPGYQRRIVVGGPLREGATIDVTILGEPGDSVYLGIARGAAYTFWPAPAGPYLLERPAPPAAAKFAIVGTIPASGALTWTTSVPADLGPGIASRNVHFQAACVDPAGTRFLTGARVLVELDQAW